MRHLLNLSFLFLLLCVTSTLRAQSGDHFFNTRPWDAEWIAPPGEGQDYGVYYFRKNIDLSASPDSYKVYVSADNRYKLYVNGALVSLGPARGDLYHWNYETVDLAKYLKAGKNTIGAIVWNDSTLRNEGQMTLRTGFILQGATKNAEIVNTNNTWKYIKDEAYQPLRYYFIAGSGQIVDMRKKINGWMSSDFDDSAWPSAARVASGYPKGASDAGWMLVPSVIPQMELTKERIPVIRETGGLTIAASFPGTKTAVTIPANTSVTLLLDQTHLTNAYFTFNFSKGSGAGVSVSYAETLYDPQLDKDKDNHPRKGNRNDVTGKTFIGLKDSLISSGAAGQSYTSLFWRTYRYVRVVVTTKAEPLVIDDIYGTFTGYPFKLNAAFNTDNADINKILEVGWRTARLDAMETYMDCPYYEQLQYIGDTRIQAMISYYNSGDDRLARNALNLMDHSRLAEGVTMSRWPSHGTQIISTFSLWYIGMLHDYWMYRPDSDFIKSKLTGERDVLDFFHNFQQADGSLKDVPYWKFVDWVGGPGWNMGGAPTGSDGCSAMLDLQLLRAYQWSAAMEAKLGMAGYAQLYQKRADQLTQTIQKKYWSADKEMFADTKEKNTFSQHVNSMAILAGIVSPSELPALAKKLLTDKSLVQCTIYFKYYLNQALVKGGLGDGYLDWLDIWRENIKMGLTTWAEDSNLDYARSDCHAWGSSPNIEFFRTVLGIDTDAPGFSKVKIQPHLGDLKKVSGKIPHPSGGDIKVAYERTQGKWKIQIALPGKLSGRLIWKGKQYDLKGGENSFSL